MKCNQCQKDFVLDELDSDSYCYECANQDPDYSINTIDMVKELLTNVVDDLAIAKKVSPSEIKTDFVSEYLIKNSEKHFKNISTKKKFIS